MNISQSKTGSQQFTQFHLKWTWKTTRYIKKYPIAIQLSVQEFSPEMIMVENDPTNNCLPMMPSNRHPCLLEAMPLPVKLLTSPDQHLSQGQHTANWPETSAFFTYLQLLILTEGLFQYITMRQIQNSVKLYEFQCLKQHIIVYLCILLNTCMNNLVLYMCMYYQTCSIVFSLILPFCAYFHLEQVC